MRRPQFTLMKMLWLMALVAIASRFGPGLYRSYR